MISTGACVCAGCLCGKQQINRNAGRQSSSWAIIHLQVNATRCWLSVAAAAAAAADLVREFHLS